MLQGRVPLTSSWPSPIFSARTINLTRCPCLPDAALHTAMERTLHTAPFTTDRPQDVAVPKVRQNCIPRVTNQWVPSTVWEKRKNQSEILSVGRTCWCKCLLPLKSFNFDGVHSPRYRSPCMRLLLEKENKSHKFNL